MASLSERKAAQAKIDAAFGKTESGISKISLKTAKRRNQMKFEKTKVFNIEGALRGMRFPMKGAGDTEGESIGPRDMKLAQALCRAGDLDNRAHSKFLRQIILSVAICGSHYWWSEADTYIVGTTANSEYTMHKLIQDVESLDLDDFWLDPENIGYFRMHVIPYLKGIVHGGYCPVKTLRLLKQALPTSFLQKRHWTADYEVIRNMYHQRKDHRLTEWSVKFCEWAESLPYAEEFIIPDRRECEDCESEG